MPRTFANNLEGKKLKLLEKYYKSPKKQRSSFYNYVLNILKTINPIQLSYKKIYLFFTQFGKCAYTGKDISFKRLCQHKSDTYYNIDHIVPKSLGGDNSIDNLVLVCSYINTSKSNHYPIPKECLSKSIRGLWIRMITVNLISRYKYENLLGRHFESGHSY